jgi:hypothetical protein
MGEKDLILKMLSGVEKVPDQAEVLVLHQFSLSDFQERGERFLSRIADVCSLSFHNSDWIEQKERTLIRLPQGARAVIYHNSGALEFNSGIAPLEDLFTKAMKDETLIKQIEEIAARLKMTEWLGKRETLKFEKLWQIKAAGADAKGNMTTPVLCRVVGAFRHFIGQIPVWGTTSAVVKLTGSGSLDSFTLQARTITDEIVDEPKIVPPDQAAQQMVKQLYGFTGGENRALEKSADVQWMHFGYLSFGKRKLQKVLAPVYVASVTIHDEKWPHACLLVAPATEKSYLPLERVGEEAPLMQVKRTG